MEKTFSVKTNSLPLTKVVKDKSALPLLSQKHSATEEWIYFYWTDTSNTLYFDFGFYRANLLGTQFTLFDNGDNPKTNYENARKELVGIIYVSDL